MKAGVSTTPCGVENQPSRAEPSLCEVRKENPEKAAAELEAPPPLARLASLTSVERRADHHLADQQPRRAVGDGVRLRRLALGIAARCVLLVFARTSGRVEVGP